MPEFCSIWDLHKELKNLADQDTLRPRNREKGPLWLLQRMDQLLDDGEIFARPFRLTRPQYRAIWLEMAKEHWGVISTLRAAAVATDKHLCLFNHAMGKMAVFLENFATKAAPFSGSPEDQEFKILMDNFGTVFDTVSIFYDCYDCEPRLDVLKYERDAGRMNFFRFDKNDPKPPLELEEIQALFRAHYPGGVRLGAGYPHRMYHSRSVPCPYENELSPESSPTVAVVEENEECESEPGFQPMVTDSYCDSAEAGTEHDIFAGISPSFHEPVSQASYNSFNNPTPTDRPHATDDSLISDTFMSSFGIPTWEDILWLDENWSLYET